MALAARQQALYWGIAAAVFLFVLWVLGDVLLPFVMGAAVAYILDPIADRLQRVGFSRLWATITITLSGVLLFLLGVLILIPTLVSQVEELARFAPQLLDNLRSWLSVTFPDLMSQDTILQETLGDLGQSLRARGGEVVNTIITGAFGLIDILVLLVLAPVITFYLLLDWDRLVARFDTLLPRDHAPVIRGLAQEIDRTLAGFVRGQGLVCLILGIYYAVALALVGLNFGLVIGFVAGALTFIPYVGALVGGVLAIGLALFQFWGDWVWILAVWAIFQSGQFVEGNILTPNLVGSSVGLHPVTLILALSVFGALFGFVGLLVAVPAAAALGVIVRFAIGKYRTSKLYLGSESAGNGTDRGQ